MARSAASCAGPALCQRVPLLFGQDAGLIHSIEPAGEIVARIIREAEAILDANAGLIRSS